MFRRKVLIAVLVIGLAGTAGFAKGLHKGAGGRRNVVERLQKRLNLSPAQVDGVRALQETRQKEMEGLRHDAQQKREINQRFNNGVKALLTPEQLQQAPKRFR
jgi:hypothetical protein